MGIILPVIYRYINLQSKTKINKDRPPNRRFFHKPYLKFGSLVKLPKRRVAVGEKGEKDK
jgi:hypothetical protein